MTDTPDPAAVNALAEQLMPILAGHSAQLALNALAYALTNVIGQMASDEEQAASIAASLGDFLCRLLEDIYSGATPLTPRAKAALH